MSDAAMNGSTSLRHEALAIGLLVVVPLALYLPVIEGPFLWDDRALIVDQLLGGSQPSIGDLFLRPFWRETAADDPYRGFYRPLTTLTYLFDAKAHGENPAGYHLTNLVFHVATVVAGFRLLRRLGAGVAAAGLAMAAFALAPRLAECVAWISGRTDVLASLFGVLGLLAYPLPTCGVLPTKTAVRRSTLAALAFAASLLCKEVGFAFVAVALADEAQHAWLGRARPPLRDALMRTAPVIIALAVYGALRTVALSGAPPVAAHYGSAPRFTATFEAIATYAAMVLDFARPRTQIGYLLARNQTMVVVGAVVAIALLGGFAFVLRRATRDEDGGRRPASPALLLGLLAVLALLPVLHIVPLAVNVIAADRFLYVVLFGALGAAALAIDRVTRASVGRGAAVAAVVLVVASGAALMHRVGAFVSEHAFWLDAATSAHPENPLPVGELGNVYYRAQEHETAYGLYAASLARHPKREPFVRGYLRTLANVANVRSSQGRYDDAIRVRHWLMTKAPPTANDIFQLGLVHLHRGDLERAAQSIDEALSRFSDMPEAQRLRKILPELEQERERIRQGRADDYARVAYLARIGARAEGTRLAAELVARGIDEPAKRFELASYVAKLADYPVAEAALSKARDLPPPVMVLMDDRRQFRAAADAAAPRVEPMLRKVEIAALLE